MVLPFPNFPFGSTDSNKIQFYTTFPEIPPRAILCFSTEGG